MSFAVEREGEVKVNSELYNNVEFLQKQVRNFSNYEPYVLGHEIWVKKGLVEDKADFDSDLQKLKELVGKVFQEFSGMKKHSESLQSHFIQQRKERIRHLTINACRNFGWGSIILLSSSTVLGGLGLFIVGSLYTSGELFGINRASKGSYGLMKTFDEVSHVLKRINESPVMALARGRLEEAVCLDDAMSDITAKESVETYLKKRDCVKKDIEDLKSKRDATQAELNELREVCRLSRTPMGLRRLVLSYTNKKGPGGKIIYKSPAHELCLTVEESTKKVEKIFKRCERALEGLNKRITSLETIETSRLEVFKLRASRKTYDYTVKWMVHYRNVLQAISEFQTPYDREVQKHEDTQGGLEIHSHEILRCISEKLCGKEELEEEVEKDREQ